MNKNQAYQTKDKPKTQFHWLIYTLSILAGLNSRLYLYSLPKMTVKEFLQIKNSQENERDDKW